MNAITSTLNLDTFKLATLVAMVNELGGNATIKTFSQRSKAVARLLKLAAEKNVDLNTTFDATGAKIEVKAEPVIESTDNTAAEAPVKAKKITVRSVAEALLTKVVSEVDGKATGLTYEEILAEVKEQFPTAKTTVGCLRWYAVRLREAGTVLPTRPRTVKAVEVKEPEAEVKTEGEVKAEDTNTEATA